MVVTKESFDDLQYFVEMAGKNKLVKANNFYCGYCSGPEGLDQVMAEYRSHANFFLVDDTTSGNTFGAKPGWFDRKVYAVHIIVGYELGNEVKYKEALNLALLSAQKLMNRQGKMVLTHVSESVMEIFEVTGFSDILTIE